jgi:uncharacterized protein YbjT (DUF2867 family)
MDRLVIPLLWSNGHRRPDHAEASVSRTILVTGATGKTGRRLVPLLVRRDVAVRAGSSRVPGAVLPGVEPVRFDWADETTYHAACKGVDAIYLVTGDRTTPVYPARQIRAVLDAAAEAGVGRVVLLSAFGVDQAPPEDPLRGIELAVAASRIPATIVRPGAFMQNFSESHWMRVVEGIRERDEIVMPGGPGIVTWVSTEDIAAVTAAALVEDGHEGKGYAVMGPEPLTLTEVAQHISVAAGRRITYVESGIEEVRAGLIAAGTRPELADQLGAVYIHALTSGAFGVRTDDVATVTGRAPTSFAEYAAGAAGAWRR